MTNKKLQKIKRLVLSVSKGFTLIETLVAVLLLSSAIAGPLTIAAKGLSTSLTAKDQVAAFFLAQDAVEYVRFKRDSNKLAGTAWLTGITGSGLCSTDGAQPCYVDSIQDTLVSTSSCPTTKCILNYDSANHYFTYAAISGTVTQTPERYVRRVIITTPVGSNTSEAALEVKVWWVGAGGIQHNVTVRENLYDW